MLVDLKIILKEITKLEKSLQRAEVDRASTKRLQEIKKRIKILIVAELKKNL
jgi:ribosomal protein S15P/S13E